MAEMYLAIGGTAMDLQAAEVCLGEARNNLELGAEHVLQARAFVQWYWLMAICAKARGHPDAYESHLGASLTDQWVARYATPVDYVPVVRQQVMMSQDLESHLMLLSESRFYKAVRPLEYYRTLKRVVEFLTNKGLVESVGLLEEEFLRAFAVIAKRTTKIGRISFVKNMAQIAALRGDTAAASRLIAVAEESARRAGLFGQVRQLMNLNTAVQQKDVRGALLTFRV